MVGEPGHLEQEEQEMGPELDLSGDRERIARALHKYADEIAAGIVRAPSRILMIVETREGVSGRYALRGIGPGGTLGHAQQGLMLYMGMSILGMSTGCTFVPSENPEAAP